ncbi:MAG: aspartate 1-decarboxylase [bacterium]|nr:aspartate 1-decarboxylase [bacterium]
MQRVMCKSKVCGLRVTHKSIEYEGSIELPPKVLEEADILPGEIVLVVNLNNGARFDTYVIKGEPGKCGLLGGAARLGDIGDKLLIISYEFMDTESAKLYNIKVVRVDDKNGIKK